MSTAERLWSLHNGVDTAELTQREDGSVWAVALVVDPDGTEHRRSICVQPPAKPKLTAEERHRNAVAAEIAAGPMGPRAAERYLRGEFEIGPQLPVLKQRPPAPPAPDAYDAAAEDRARLKALADALENPRPPVYVQPTETIEDERRQARIDLALDAAVERWKELTV